MGNTLSPLLTSVGIAAVFNANNDGLQAHISHIAIGDGTWMPGFDATNLNNEIERVEILNSERLGPHQIHITAAIPAGAPEFWVHEIGVFLSDGTMLAIWASETTPIAYRSETADFLLSFDLKLEAVPADSVIVDGTGGISLAPADTNRFGVVKLVDPTNVATLPLTSKEVMTKQATLELLNHKWGVEGFEQIDVGAGKDYETLQEAWNALKGKQIDRDIKIKVANGTYDWTGVTLNGQPFASRIKIEGDVTTPSACAIRFTGISNGIVIDGCQGLVISGFRLEGNTTEAHFTHQLMLVRNGSFVYCSEGSMEFDKAHMGVEVQYSARLICDGATFQNILHHNIYANGGASIHCRRSNIVGIGQDTYTTIPTNIDRDERQYASYGIFIADGAQAWTRGSVISNCHTGLTATRNAYLHADDVNVSNCRIGFYAGAGGEIWAHWNQAYTTTPESHSQATNCIYGYYAAANGTMVAVGAYADNCTDGFRCSQGGFMNSSNARSRNNTQNGFVASYGSFMNASGTSSASTGNATKYSPATSGTHGNVGGMIYWS